MMENQATLHFLSGWPKIKRGKSNLWLFSRIFSTAVLLLFSRTNWNCIIFSISSPPPVLKKICKQKYYVVICLNSFFFGNCITHYVKGQKKMCVWRQSQWKPFNENFNCWVLGFDGIFELYKCSKSVHSSMWWGFFSSWSWLPSPPLALVYHRPSPLNSPPSPFMPNRQQSHLQKKLCGDVLTCHGCNSCKWRVSWTDHHLSHRPPSLTHTLCIQGLVIFCNL